MRGLTRYRNILRPRVKRREAGDQYRPLSTNPKRRARNDRILTQLATVGTEPGGTDRASQLVVPPHHGQTTAIRRVKSGKGGCPVQESRGFSSCEVAQWQSGALITLRALVRIQPSQPSQGPHGPVPAVGGLQPPQLGAVRSAGALTMNADLLRVAEQAE